VALSQDCAIEIVAVACAHHLPSVGRSQRVACSGEREDFLVPALCRWGEAQAACLARIHFRRSPMASMELKPAKARFLLQLALLKTKDPKQIESYYNRY
jgi:hypothetical protein